MKTKNYPKIEGFKHKLRVRLDSVHSRTDDISQNTYCALYAQ